MTKKIQYIYDNACLCVCLFVGVFVCPHKSAPQPRTMKTIFACLSVTKNDHFLMGIPCEWRKRVCDKKWALSSFVKVESEWKKTMLYSQSELSVVGTKWEVENTLKCTHITISWPHLSSSYNPLLQRERRPTSESRRYKHQKTAILTENRNRDWYQKKNKSLETRPSCAWHVGPHALERVIICSMIWLGESSGFRKYRTLLVFQSLSWRLRLCHCHCLCLCHRLCLSLYLCFFAIIE